MDKMHKQAKMILIALLELEIGRLLKSEAIWEHYKGGEKIFIDSYINHA